MGDVGLIVMIVELTALLRKCRHYIAGAFCFGLLASCESLSQVAGVRATDLSTIQIGSDREYVEKVLGPSVDEVLGGNYEIWNTYVYNTGVEARPSMILMAPLEIATGYVVLTGICLSDIEECDTRSEVEYRINRENIYIRYDSASLVREITTSYPKLVGIERWKNMCVAAHNGITEAQYRLAHHFRYGRFYDEVAMSLDISTSSGSASEFDRPEANLTHAYVWYALAARTMTIAEYSKDRVAEEMTPEEVSEAERLVAEWQSNPAECEAEGIQPNA